MIGRPLNTHTTKAATCSVTVEFAPMYGIPRYIVLSQAIEMLTCCDYLGSVRFRHEAQRFLQHWRLQVAHGVYGLQPRKVLTVEITWYRTRTGSVHPRVSSVLWLTIKWIHTITRGKHMSPDIGPTPLH